MESRDGNSVLSQHSRFLFCVTYSFVSYYFAWLYKQTRLFYYIILSKPYFELKSTASVLLDIISIKLFKFMVAFQLN